MVAFHYKFVTIDETYSLISQFLDNNFFMCKDYNRVRYLSIRISRIDKIIIFGL